MTKLKMSSEKKSEKQTIKLTGVMNENSNFDSVDFSDSNEIILDLGGVSLINSIGIRGWLKWCQSLPKDKPVQIINAPKAMIDQANMLSNFFPKQAKILSLELPYFCDNCEKTHSLFFEIGSNLKSNDVPTTSMCPHCKKTAQLDIVQESYFNFLK